MKPVSVEDLERVARLYKSNKEASAALGIHPRSFARLCRQHGIPTPYVRRRRARTVLSRRLIGQNHSGGSASGCGRGEKGLVRMPPVRKHSRLP